MVVWLVFKEEFDGQLSTRSGSHAASEGAERVREGVGGAHRPNKAPQMSSYHAANFISKASLPATETIEAKVRGC